MGLKFKKMFTSLKNRIKVHRLNHAALTDLESLSYNVPKLKTKELCVQNDFYFHAYHLKKYCKFPLNIPLKCSIEHGISFDAYVWELDYKHNFPGFISISENRKQYIKKYCNKKFYSIGPYIRYADSFLSDKKLEKDKKRLGKNLLVFPAHSTHYVDTNYDAEEFCKEIEKIKNEYKYDSVRVCVYWKDILLNMHKYYQEKGYECVCAGHMFSKSFLPRLKSIIEPAHTIMANDFGTYAAYGLALNKPFYYYKQKITHEVDSLIREQEKEIEEGVIAFQEEMKEIENAFNKYSDTITEEQYKIAQKYFSVSTFKSKEELLSIFNEFENSYKE